MLKVSSCQTWQPIIHSEGLFSQHPLPCKPLHDALGFSTLALTDSLEELWTKQMAAG